MQKQLCEKELKTGIEDSYLHQMIVIIIATVGLAIVVALNLMRRGKL